jgi:hypothetical protein
MDLKSGHWFSYLKKHNGNNRKGSMPSSHLSSFLIYS